MSMTCAIVDQSKHGLTQQKDFLHPLVVRAFNWIETDTKDPPV